MVVAQARTRGQYVTIQMIAFGCKFTYHGNEYVLQVLWLFFGF
jgi:hypothetical protein